MEGLHVRLELLRPDAHTVDLYSALHHDPTGRQWTYMAYGPFRDQASFGDFIDAATRDPAVIVFGIIDKDTGRAQGMAGYSRIDPAAGSIEVGGVMYGPGLKRSPAGTEAMYLMAANVFDHLGYRRYEWKCDALNAESIAAAKRLGFSYEGTWRNATIYKGRNRDTAWFSMTEYDWPVIRSKIQAWLDPANFIAGRQRKALSEVTTALSPSSS